MDSRHLHPTLAQIFDDMDRIGRLKVDLPQLQSWITGNQLRRGIIAKSLASTAAIRAAQISYEGLTDMLRALEQVTPPAKGTDRLGSRRRYPTDGVDTTSYALFSQYGDHELRYLALFSGLLQWSDDANLAQPEVLRACFQAADPKSPKIVDAGSQQAHTQLRLIRKARRNIIFSGLSLFRGKVEPTEGGDQELLETVPLFPADLDNDVRERTKNESLHIRVLLVNPFSDAGRVLARAYRPRSPSRDPIRTALRTVARFRGQMGMTNPASLQLRLTNSPVPSTLSIDDGSETLLWVPGLDHETSRFPGIILRQEHLDAAVDTEAESIWRRLEGYWNDGDDIEIWERQLTIEQREYFARVADEERLVPTFAYGFNLLDEKMKRRCPGAVRLGAAMLDAHRLEFLRRGTWETDSLVSCVVPDEEECVYGAVWGVPERELRMLDILENPLAYRRETRPIWLVGGQDLRSAEDFLGPRARSPRSILIQAEIYLGLPDWSPGPFQVTDAYYTKLREGLVAAGFGGLALQKLTEATQRANERSAKDEQNLSRRNLGTHPER